MATSMAITAIFEKASGPAVNMKISLPGKWVRTKPGDCHIIRSEFACIQGSKGAPMKSQSRYSLLLATLFLLGISLMPVSADDGPGSQGKIKAALQPFVDREELAGAVGLVANRDRVLDVEALGYADVGAKRPLIVQAIFWIASQSKPITAALLMMLVDEGKVSLDDPVEKYLPEFKGQRVATKDGGAMKLQPPQHPITVREILSHTSGLPFRTAKESPTLDVLTLRDGAKSYAETPLTFEPGTKYSYSNAGINTTGRIIEVVSGMAFEDFLAKRLTGPLGMKDTTFWPNEEQLKRRAKSYRAGKDKTGLIEMPIDQLKYPLNDRRRQPMPAGGLFSTAEDVARFCQMVLGGGEFDGKRYLSEAAVKEMTRRQTSKDIKESYGLGWSVSPNGFGHGGAYSTNMSVDTKRGMVVIWMVQQAGVFPGNGGRAHDAFRKAAEEIFKNSAR
jgi:CubicO group peptidase (beta-lactamase class C family)